MLRDTSALGDTLRYANALDFSVLSVHRNWERGQAGIEAVAVVAWLAVGFAAEAKGRHERVHIGAVPLPFVHRHVAYLGSRAAARRGQGSQRARVRSARGGQSGYDADFQEPRRVPEARVKSALPHLHDSHLEAAPTPRRAATGIKGLRHSVKDLILHALRRVIQLWCNIREELVVRKSSEGQHSETRQLFSTQRHIKSTKSSRAARRPHNLRVNEKDVHIGEDSARHRCHEVVVALPTCDRPRSLVPRNTVLQNNAH